MTDGMAAIMALYTAAWKDKELRTRFMNDPKGVFKEHGVEMPAILDFSSVDDCMHAPNCVHVTLDGGACFCVRADPCADC